MDPVAVRVAAPADAPALAELLRSYHERTEEEKVAHGLQELGPLAAGYAAEIADPLRGFAGAAVLCALRADAVVGMLVVKPDGELKRLWVDPAARGGGIGTALLAAAAERARAAGAASLRLSVWDWRDDARGLYRAHGFVDAP